MDPSGAALITDGPAPDRALSHAPAHRGEGREPPMVRTTQERILSAALAAFAHRGVAATSLDAVAAAVGVRKQTLLYWFPSKEQLLFGVIDHAIAEIAARLGAAAAAGPSLERRLVGVVDATFRLGTTNPELLAVVREVTRLGPPASTRLAAAVAPLVEVAASALGASDDERVGKLLLATGARVIGIVTEAEVRSDVGLPADLAWLRGQRRALLASLVGVLAEPGPMPPGAVAIRRSGPRP